LYSAAEYVATQTDMNLVQLVSFGCGLDAITTDEVPPYFGRKRKNYTQIKIDEITNLCAVKIRLRSLLPRWNSEGYKVWQNWYTITLAVCSLQRK
jgi:predicted nucleotide-binding protein (sugar kinase/HSP70/actin superfamily)